MNILIIYCHPSKKSFTYQVFDRLLNGLKTSGHKVTVSDLYEMNFQSDMSEIEYEREGFVNLEIGRASCRERVYVLV